MDASRFAVRCLRATVCLWYSQRLSRRFAFGFFSRYVMCTCYCHFLNHMTSGSHSMLAIGAIRSFRFWIGIAKKLCSRYRQCERCRRWRLGRSSTSAFASCRVRRAISISALGMVIPYLQAWQEIPTSIALGSIHLCNLADHANSFCGDSKNFDRTGMNFLKLIGECTCGHTSQRLVFFFMTPLTMRRANLMQ